MLRSTAARGASLLALLALLELLAHPLLSGGSLRSWALYELYTALGVILPGALLVARWLPCRGDWLFGLGLGWALGHALELVALLLARAVGEPRLFLIWIPLAGLAWAVGPRRAAPPAALAQPLRCAAGLILVLLLAGSLGFALSLPELSRVPPRLSDLWFHAENAHEFRDHAPLQDPRLAGEPLNYHVHAYAAAAAASLATGEAVAPLLIRYTGMGWLFLAALGWFNLGRACSGGSALAGAASALLLLLPLDVPALFASGLESGSALQLFGVYLSTTTLAGHAYLSALLLLVYRHCRGAPWRCAWALALLAFAGAGAKAMFGPVVLGGALGGALWQSLRRGQPDGRGLGLAGVLAAGVLPAALPLLGREGSYAESAAAGFGVVAGRMPWSASLSGLGAPGWLARGLWIFAFAALPLLGAAIASAARRGDPGDARFLAFAWSAFGVAGLAALGLELSGASSLFFLYYGSAALAGIAGPGLAILLRWRGMPLLAGALLLAWVGLRLASDAPFSTGLAPDERITPSIWRRAAWWRYAVSERERVAVADADLARLAPLGPRLALGPDLREGLAWARRHLPADAVFAVNVPDAAPYGALSEARAFLETLRFHPRTHAAGPAAAAAHFAERARAVEAWQRGDADAAQRLSGAGVTHLFVDRANARWLPPPLAGARPLFERRDFAIYELPGAPEAPRGASPSSSARRLQSADGSSRISR